MSTQPLRNGSAVAALAVAAAMLWRAAAADSGGAIPNGTDARAAAEEAYGTFCAQCHQLDGRGITGTYPALDGSALVNGDAKLLARLVLDGGFANNAMPVFKVQLSEAQAAQILSFIRTSWSNSATPVTTAQVLERNEDGNAHAPDGGTL